MGRAPCCEKVGLNKGKWSAEEDAILMNYITQNNGEAGSWRSLPKKAGLLRCGKSCRLRWINYLRSDLKRGNFTSHEDDIIIKLHASLGNKWSVIANQLAGRTDNEIKNYWNSSLCRRITYTSSSRPSDHHMDGQKVMMNAEGVNNNNVIVIKKRRRGRTSRAAMKKNKSSTNYGGGGRSNKYLQAAAAAAPGPYDSNHLLLVGSSISSSSSSMTAVNYNSSALLLPQTPSTVGIRKVPPLADQGGSIIYSFWSEQDDDALLKSLTSNNNQNGCGRGQLMRSIQYDDELVNNAYCSTDGVELSFDDIMARGNYNLDDELAEVDVPIKALQLATTNDIISTSSDNDEYKTIDEEAEAEAVAEDLDTALAAAGFEDYATADHWDWQNIVHHQNDLSNDQDVAAITCLWEYANHQQQPASHVEYKSDKNEHQEHKDAMLAWLLS
ncbi:unnamed protein product [Rhodiola kirilowii]